MLSNGLHKSADIVSDITVRDRQPVCCPRIREEEYHE